MLKHLLQIFEEKMVPVSLHIESYLLTGFGTLLSALIEDFL